MTKHEIAPLIRLAQEQGWVVTKTNGEHLRFVPPDRTKRMVFTASTPGDQRGFQNLRSDLRRSGLVL